MSGLTLGDLVSLLQWLIGGCIVFGVWLLGLQGKVNVLRSRVDGIEKRVDGLEDRILAHLERIESRLDSLLQSRSEK